MTPELEAQIDAVADAIFLGKATAAKRGSNAAYPYVPVIDHTEPGCRRRTTNPTRERAYATRAEAVAVAQERIDGTREMMRGILKMPRSRGPRKQHGLPEWVD